MSLPRCFLYLDTATVFVQKVCLLCLQFKHITLMFISLSVFTLMMCRPLLCVHVAWYFYVSVTFSQVQYSCTFSQVQYSCTFRQVQYICTFRQVQYSRTFRQVQYSCTFRQVQYSCTFRQVQYSSTFSFVG